MQDSNSGFGSDEITLIKDKDFYIRKNIALQKITAVLQDVSEEIDTLKNQYTSYLPDDVKRISGKISRGENYLGLPYLVSDNPRLFSQKDIFAYRCMFWWGNYFSFTLHISGKHYEQFQAKIFKSLDSLKNKNFLLCINNDPWQHHLEKENFISLDNADFAAIKDISQKNYFLKLSRKLELENISELKNYSIATFREYIHLLTL